MATHTQIMTTDHRPPTPESETRRVPQRQAGRGRCTASFFPRPRLYDGPLCFAAALIFSLTKNHTCFGLFRPLLGNGDEFKDGLACSLLTVLWVVQRAGNVPAMGLFRPPQ